MFWLREGNKRCEGPLGEGCEQRGSVTIAFNEKLREGKKREEKGRKGKTGNVGLWWT